MARRLLLICHGATAATRRGAFPADEPLEDAATARAAALRPLPGRSDRVFTAPALRARQTAAAMALAAQVDTDLRDLDLGRWAGRELAEVHAAEPDGLAAWLADAEAAPHGGESLAELRQRTSDWLAGHVADRGATLAVSHAAVIRAAVLTVLDAPSQSFWRLDIEPLSITELRSDGTRWILRAVGKPFGDG